MSAFICELVIPDVVGLKAQQLTVGRDFIFKCSGELPIRFNADEARMVLNEKYKYDFFLRKLIVTDSKNFDLYMVSYVTGKVSVPEIYVTDGVNQIALQVGDINVDSVLPAPVSHESQQPEKIEPFGYLTAHLNWPVGYTLFFVTVLVATIALTILQWKRRKRLRNLVKDLKDYESPLPADSQFYKGLRYLEKQNYPIHEVEKQFRIYVIRKYQVPLFGLTLNETMKYLKRKWPTYTAERRELQNILLDLKKISDDPNQDLDIRQYLKKIYKFVDVTEEKMKTHHQLDGQR